MHPLAGDFSNLKDAELETKVGDLTKRYFQTHNTDVRQQISMLLDSFNEELSRRRQAALEKVMSNRDKNLDKLINVNWRKFCN